VCVTAQMSGDAAETASSEKRRRRTTSVDGEDAMERLEMTEKLILELNETWEEKMKRTEQIRHERSVPFAVVSVSVLVFIPSESGNLCIQ